MSKSDYENGDIVRFTGYGRYVCHLAPPLANMICVETRAGNHIVVRDQWCESVDHPVNRVLNNAAKRAAEWHSYTDKKTDDEAFHVPGPPPEQAAPTPRPQRMTFSVPLAPQVNASGMIPLLQSALSPEQFNEYTRNIGVK